ncbi:class I SAM-dependent methyltransferase [Solicola gregarius]|uniref:Class I SAM-dependent methyltransferase n=1 Tax=Solicola gregarius TaxID=2908642 RepID=A0AA46YKE7_9ACTN|nr:class I SAM-dependent methyltransferase [Solicola gregarius]UYM05685.1 class I SAM-dependent methyltransferase [Solicola gregarius]
MTTTADTPQIDEERLMSFVFRAVDELGASLNAALVLMGDRLGYYRTMADGRPVTPAELAERTHTDVRYTREWLNAQAAGQYIEYSPETGGYTLPAEHAVALADENSPAYLPGFFQIVNGTVSDAPQVIERARTGDGLGWHAHNSDVHTGCERFFRPQYNANVVSSWLPALEGVVDKLTAGARVADVGCGHGASTIVMAQAFERSTFVGSDYHAKSIATARTRAENAGVSDRITFEQTDAQSLAGGPYDLVTMFDCLHDMGDPISAARQVLDNLAHDGTWMVVEPIAGDHVEDNLNPVGRAYYAFSTLLCTPASLSQDGRLAIGTQAGEARLTEVLSAAGFTRIRRVAETPFNMVLEVRP